MSWIPAIILAVVAALYVKRRRRYPWPVWVSTAATFFFLWTFSYAWITRPLYDRARPHLGEYNYTSGRWWETLDPAGCAAAIVAFLLVWGIFASLPPTAESMSSRIVMVGVPVVFLLLAWAWYGWAW